MQRQICQGNPLLYCPYHVEPEDPEIYERQSNRFNFCSPNRFPCKAVNALTLPPVAMTATTGTCWA